MSDSEQQLNEVLAAYREAQAGGWAPDPDLLLRCYPHLAEELDHFFHGRWLVDGVLRPLHGASPDAHATGPTPPVGRTIDSGATVDVTGTTASEAEGGWPALPGYEVLDELGRGGMGLVYRARQVQADRVVAVKMILAGIHAG